MLLTLNVLNCIKDYKRWIHTSYHILDFFSTEEHQIHNAATLHAAYPMLSIPFLLMPWRQGISRHGIDPHTWNILSPASDELKPLLIDTKVVKCFSTWQKHLKVIIYSPACKVYTTACCVNMNYSVTIDPPYSQGVICHGCYINSMWPNDAMLHHGP